MGDTPGRIAEIAAVFAGIAVAALAAIVIAKVGRAVTAAMDAEEPLPPEWVNDRKENRP